MGSPEDQSTPEEVPESMIERLQSPEPSVRMEAVKVFFDSDRTQDEYEVFVRLQFEDTEQVQMRAALVLHMLKARHFPRYWHEYMPVLMRIRTRLRKEKGIE